MWVTPEQIEKAKQMDLLTYLQSYEPNNLKRFRTTLGVPKNTIRSKYPTVNGIGFLGISAEKQLLTIS